MIPPTGLLHRWGSDEERLRELGQESAARLAKRYREELSTWWRERQLDLLTLGEAAAYSGLTAGTLGNKIRAGEIPNAGDKHRPRVRRCDLPARAPGPSGCQDLDLADTILVGRTP